jgi:hypothetical protein
MSILLCGETSGRDPERPGGDHERSIGTDERLCEHLDGAVIGVGGALEVSREREVVLEREMDYAAEAGIAVFKIAFDRWIDETDQSDLPQLIHESLDELKAVTASS